VRKRNFGAHIDNSIFTLRTTIMISCIPLRHGRQCCIHVMSNTPASSSSSSSSSLSIIRGTFKRFASANPSPLLQRRRSIFNYPTTMLTYTSILQPEHSSSSVALRPTTGVVDAATALFSTRRRTRRSSGGHFNARDDEQGGHDASGGSNTRESNNTIVMMAMEQFQSAANSLLDKVEVALVKLKDCNDQLEIVRHPPTSVSSSLNPSTTTTDDSTLVGNGATTSDDDTILQHGGKLSITVLSSADLYWGGGTYSLTIHTNDEYYDDANSENSNDSSGTIQGGGGFITFQSPLSGTYTYIYNVTTREWVGEEDGHSLLGMLTRDWIRQCNGVPDF